MSRSDEENIYGTMAVVCIIVVGITAIMALIMFGFAAYDRSVTEAVIAISLTGGAVSAAWGASYFGGLLDPSRIRPSTGENALTWRQKRELRRARGSVVMEKALIEVEHERQNIVHKEIEAAEDPQKPPHETRWSPGGPSDHRPIARREYQ